MPVALLDEVLGARDVIGEGVLLLKEPAAVVPRPSENLAPANVGEGEDESPIEETEGLEGKAGVVDDHVGAVAVEEEGRVVAGLEVAPVDEGYGNARAVFRFGEEPLGDVARGVEAASDPVSFQEPSFASPHVVVVYT